MTVRCLSAGADRAVGERRLHVAARARRRAGAGGARQRGRARSLPAALQAGRAAAGSGAAG